MDLKCGVLFVLFAAAYWKIPAALGMPRFPCEGMTQGSMECEIGHENLYSEQYIDQNKRIDQGLQTVPPVHNSSSGNYSKLNSGDVKQFIARQSPHNFCSDFNTSMQHTMHSLPQNQQYQWESDGNVHVSGNNICYHQDSHRGFPPPSALHHMSWGEGIPVPTNLPDFSNPIPEFLLPSSSESPGYPDTQQSQRPPGSYPGHVPKSNPIKVEYSTYGGPCITSNIDAGQRQIRGQSYAQTGRDHKYDALAHHGSKSFERAPRFQNRDRYEPFLKW